MYANGATTGLNGSLAWSRCAARFIVDGAPVSNDVNYGDMVVSPAQNGSGSAEWSSFSLSRQVTVSAGAHTVKVQFATAPTSAATGTCLVDAQPHSGVRLFVTAH
jgi:hypothetical protein